MFIIVSRMEFIYFLKSRILYGIQIYQNIKQAGRRLIQSENIEFPVSDKTVLTGQLPTLDV